MEPIEFNESLQSKERLLYDFDCIYAHWKSQAKKVKQGVVNKAPIANLQDCVNSVERDLENLNDIYNAIDAPTSDLCHKLAKCVQITKKVVNDAIAQIARTKEELNYQNETAVELAAVQAFLNIIAEQEQHKQRLKQLEAEQVTSQQSMEKMKRELEHLEELKGLNVTHALLPTPKQLVREPDLTVESLDMKGTLVQLEATSASDSIRVNETEAMMKPVAQKEVDAKKPVAAKRTAAAKKPQKMAAKKPAATKKSPKKAKKVAAKGGQKKSTKSPKKQVGNKDKGPTNTRKSKMKDHGNKTRNWKGKRKLPKRKERTNFKEVRKKGVCLKCATVGGNHGRPPD